MTMLITMAGLGTRFSAAGYTVPKYRISARGRTLFDWSLQSLQRFVDQPLVLAVLSGEQEDWLLAESRSAGFADVRIQRRAAPSLGQAETAYDALDMVPPDQPLWIYNIDTYVEKGMSPGDMDGAQGCIHVFPSHDPGMSFVAYAEQGLRVTRIAEKQVISRWATVGMYGFASAALYRRCYEDAYLAGKVALVKGERYIAPMYQLLLDDGKTLVAPQLAADDVHVLGTPAQLLDFDPAATAPFGATA